MAKWDLAGDPTEMAWSQKIDVTVLGTKQLTSEAIQAVYLVRYTAYPTFGDSKNNYLNIDLIAQFDCIDSNPLDKQIQLECVKELRGKIREIIKASVLNDPLGLIDPTKSEFDTPSE